MPVLTTLSLRAGEQPGALGSPQTLPSVQTRIAATPMPTAFVALLAVNLFVVSGAACFSLLYFHR